MNDPFGNLLTNLGNFASQSAPLVSAIKGTNSAPSVVGNSTSTTPSPTGVMAGISSKTMLLIGGGLLVLAAAFFMLRRK